MRENNPEHIVSSMMGIQKSDRDLILQSILVAVGVNILSSGIVELINPPSKGILLMSIGLFVCIVTAVYLSYSKYRKLKRKLKIKGVFIYNSERKKLVPIKQYEISEKMCDYLASAFVENKALKRHWLKDDLVAFCDKSTSSKKPIKIAEHHSKKILIELIEYCVIEKLSMHLEEYFNCYNHNKHIQEYGRESIPDILLQNRFLRLFSENMNNREAFSDHFSLKKKNVVYAISDSGAVYNFFSLFLPKKSKVMRQNDKIVVSMPFLTLSIGINFEGVNTILKRGFPEHYLKIPLFYTDHNVYSYDINVSVKFNLLSLSRRGIDFYYGWIDSFIDSLIEYCSIDDFMTRINWRSNYALIHSIKDIASQDN